MNISPQATQEAIHAIHEEQYRTINVISNKSDTKIFGRDVILDPAVCRYPQLISGIFFLILSSEWYSIFCNILVFSNRRVTGSHHSTRGLDKKSINHDKRCFCGRISLGKQLHCYPDANEWLRWRVLVHGESE